MPNTVNESETEIKWFVMQSLKWGFNPLIAKQLQHSFYFEFLVPIKLPFCHVYIWVTVCTSNRRKMGSSLRVIGHIV